MMYREFRRHVLPNKESRSRRANMRSTFKRPEPPRVGRERQPRRLAARWLNPPLRTDTVLLMSRAVTIFASHIDNTHELRGMRGTHF